MDRAAATGLLSVTNVFALLRLLPMSNQDKERRSPRCATAHPTASWVAQAARNLGMDLEDAGCRARFLIRDRDGKFPGLFDVILADAGIKTVLSGVRMPRMNSIMERWVQTCRRELLDRTLIWNRSHLLHALREFEQFYKGTGGTRASPTPARSSHCPRRWQLLTKSPALTSDDVTDSPKCSTNTAMRHELHG